MMLETCVAIIPARGGSKGIPLKNLRQIHGESLLARCIRTAKEAGIFHRIYVSTDHPEIMQEALRNQADVIHRPDEISGDTDASELALLHALDSMDRLPDYTFMLQCTAPLTKAEDMVAAYDMLQQGYDSVFAATNAHPFLWGLDENKQAVPLNHPGDYRPMRQELPPTYQEAGAINAFRTNMFLETKYRYFGKIGLVEIPAYRVLDIDTVDDLRKAEIWLKG